MSYCLNPACTSPQNSRDSLSCQSCGAKLLLKERYRAIKPIGQGGFGKTFLAVDQDKPSSLPCVIKLFFPSSQGTDSINKATELFNQEAQRLESLGKHSQIPELVAHFEQEKKLYLVQEYIKGQNLAEILSEEGVFSETQMRALLANLLPVLQFVHENNVIHRDIKPENIIKRNDGQYVLVDFGAARYVTGTALLRTGTIIGDVRYMSDEQLQGKATFASDIYSLGLTCLHLLTQVEPWNLFDTSEGEWGWRDYLTTPISQELGQVLDKMVQKATKRRFQNVGEVLEALRVYSVQPSLVTPPIQPSLSTPPRPPQASSSSNLKPIKQGNHYGYVDTTGMMVISPVFDYAKDFSEGLALVKLNDSWGFINTTGRIVTELFQEIGDFSAGLALVKLNYRWGFIDKTGKIVTKLFDEIGNFSEGLAKVKIYDKYSYIDKTGEIVIPLQFNDADSFSEGLAKVRLNDKYGYIDKTGEIVIPLQFSDADSFSEGLAKVGIYYNKYGYIDKTGEIIIPLQFVDADSFSEGMAGVRLNNKWGFINKIGIIVIPFQFAQVSPFSEGLAKVSLNDKYDYKYGYKYGYIDKTGKLVTQWFDDVWDFSEGLALVKLNGKWGFIDKTGKIVIQPQFVEAKPFENGRAKVTKEQQGWWRIYFKAGYIDKIGKWIEDINQGDKTIQNF